MSFFNSIKVLFNKIEQKNIVLVSGNVDEVISIKSKGFDLPVTSKIDGFISVIDIIAEYANNKEYKTIEFFSASKGVIDLSSNKKNEKEIEKKKPSDDEFGDLEDGNTSSSINDYVNLLTEYLNNIDKSYLSKHSSIHIIDCTDIFLDKSGNGIEPAKLAELISNFLSFNKNSNCLDLITNQKKLIFIARNPQTITNFVPINNIEFASVDIAKPDKNEREDFFNSYKSLFNVKDTINNPDHEDFRDAISITDSLSFKEILQLAKLNMVSNDSLTFKQLYNLANFNKKDSEWEKLDINKIKNINKYISDRVKGQDYAVQAIKTTLIRSFTGLNGITQSTNSRKPKGVLFLAGPTGTGKTEISKAICEFVFGDESRLIRFDMSEYNHEHSDQRLIGAPPGYVGYDAGGQLTSSVKNKPFSILLFDEIEKAHGKILDKFLQILEDGRLTSSQGETIDFSETFIIFTSNIGSSSVKPNDDQTSTRKSFIKAVIDHFKTNLQRPEILNRIGIKNIVPFNFITDKEIINEILEVKLLKITKSLKEEKSIALSIDQQNKDRLFEIISSKFNNEMGGRGLIVELETVFIDKLSIFIFENYEEVKLNKKNNKFSNVKIEISNLIPNFKFI